MCPILILGPGQLRRVRATVAMACGAQSMMSANRAPGGGLHRRLTGNSVDRREFDAADVGLGSERNGRGAQRHGGDSPSVAVSTRHHLEQPTVGAAEDAVVQLTTAASSENSTGVIGVRVRGTECSSAIDPFRSPFGRSPSTAAAQAPT
jgi:hypothetical protein